MSWVKKAKLKNVKIKKRRITWTFIFIFLLAGVVLEATQDIISDYLFFGRSQEGAFSPIEAILYWYYTPALVYFIFLSLAIVFALTKIISPITFSYILCFFAGIGFFLSLKKLGINPIVFFLLAIPFLLLIFVLYYSMTIKVKGRQVKI